ncbi:MAG: ribose-5-phosphate isomerase RpiA [Thermoplasmata archaeon]|nr:ribose-5-phosphate isomerase RpiA [Thermoplasmata archaeon]
MPDPDTEKKAAATAGVSHLRAGMRVALGTGSTTRFAVQELAERFPNGEGLELLVASSRATEAEATAHGLPVRPLHGTDRFDVMLDGADEVTPSWALTKGGGGALLREKLLARLSRELIIMVDASKLVSRLGDSHRIPIEVVPFARPVVEDTLRQGAWDVQLRRASGGDAPWLTDNGNEILDLQPAFPILDPRAVAGQLRDLTGVVETGIFLGLAHRIYVGQPDGTVRELPLPVP